MRYKIAILLLMPIIVMAGCQAPQIPEQEYYGAVLDSQYGPQRLCHHKARDYWEHLVERGYQAYWVIGRMDGQGHSWVEYINERGERILIDPTVKSVRSGHLRNWYRNYETIACIDPEKIEEWPVR